MHRFELKRGKHHSSHMQRSWDKYGESSFDFSVLEECAKGQLFEREQHYIDLLHPAFNGVAVVKTIQLTPELETKRRESLKSHHAARKTCYKGHGWTQANTQINRNGYRVCVACRDARRKRRKDKLAIPEQKSVRCKQIREAYADNLGRPIIHQKDRLTPEVRAKISKSLMARYSHCKQGHPFDESNTLIEKCSGKRICRACRKALRKKLRDAETPQQKQAVREQKKRSWWRNHDKNLQNSRERFGTAKVGHATSRTLSAFTPIRDQF